jgi:6-phosphogluconolactonase (cycloisomerase 2 family)
VCDLGQDKVLVYTLDSEAGRVRECAEVALEPTQVRAQVGTPCVSSNAELTWTGGRTCQHHLLWFAQGPRHIAFHPTLRCAYIVNELKNTVTALKYNAQDLAGDKA